MQTMKPTTTHFIMAKGEIAEKQQTGTSPYEIYLQHISLAKRITEVQRNEIAEKLFHKSCKRDTSKKTHSTPKKPEPKIIISLSNIQKPCKTKLQPINSLYKMSLKFILNE